MSLLPHEHFSIVYAARIEETNKKVIVGMNIPPHLPQGVPTNVELEYKTEREIGIYMGESKFKQLMDNHTLLLDIIHGMSDHRIREQFEKLMILIKLTK